MMIEAFGAFATAELRPAASAADAACAAPPELLAQSAELGIAVLGVPEELGGAVDERSAVTSALITEALAGGDMGLAYATLAPAAVSTALGLWGDADQQADLPARFHRRRTSRRGARDPGARRPLRSVRADDEGAPRAATASSSTASSRSFPRAAEAELFVDRRRPRGLGPGAVHRRGGRGGAADPARAGDRAARRRRPLS